MVKRGGGGEMTNFGLSVQNDMGLGTADALQKRGQHVFVSITSTVV